MLSASEPITAEAVKLLASASTTIDMPKLIGEPVDLDVYKNLLEEVAS